MEKNSVHYDGSVQNVAENQVETSFNANEPFEITDEMRKSISGNPYVMK